MVFCNLCHAPLGRKAKWYADGKPVCLRDAQSYARARYHNSKGYRPMPERLFRKVLADYLESANERHHTDVSVLKASLKTCVTTGVTK